MHLPFQTAQCFVSSGVQASTFCRPKLPLQALAAGHGIDCQDSTLTDDLFFALARAAIRRVASLALHCSMGGPLNALPASMRVIRGGLGVTRGAPDGNTGTMQPVDKCMPQADPSG